MNTLVKFLPLLVLYTLIILFFTPDEIQADEPRYIMYAENILAGSYTNPDNPELMNAPGYPLYLTPFLGLGLPLIVPKLFNALLMFLAVVFLYKTLVLYLPEKTAVVSAYILGLYYPMFRWIIFNISEALSIFLLCAFLYYAILFLRSSKSSVKMLALPAFLLGYLILVKLFYQYVVLATFAFSLMYFLVFREQKAWKAALIFGIGYLIAAVPWLGYTYSITGKPFYWGTQTGQKIYWMTTPYEGEYGKWFPMDGVVEGRFPELHPGHRALYSSIQDKTPMERNEILLKVSKENIKKNPGNYVLKIIPNTLRLLFAYPMHLKPNLVMYFYAFIHTLLLIPLLISLYPAWLYRKDIPPEIYIMMLFNLIYFGGLCLIPTVPRYFFMMVPFILLWTSYVFTYFVQISTDNRLREVEKNRIHEKVFE